MIKIPHEKMPETSGQKILKKRRKISAASSIRTRMLQKQLLKDNKILGQTVLDLVKYLKSPHLANLEGINDLSDNMQRSIICLQRHKKKIVEKNSKKR